MFFINKVSTFFGLNLTLVYTFPMCMAWRFHFPIRKYDFKTYTYFPELCSCHTPGQRLELLLTILYCLLPMVRDIFPPCHSGHSCHGNRGGLRCRRLHHKTSLAPSKEGRIPLEGICHINVVSRGVFSLLCNTELYFINM